MYMATPPHFLCGGLYDTIDNQAVEQDKKKEFFIHVSLRVITSNANLVSLK